MSATVDPAAAASSDGSHDAQAAVGAAASSSAEAQERDAAWRQALAARLLQLRTAAGLSPEGLASAANVDAGFYAQLEVGHADLHELRYTDVIALARALGLSPAKLLTGMPDDDPPPP